ncbi:hypothetical protein IH781_03855, partial [Patescibacteria group bacterium]|nr:hypothetical protein [Patescibacteria group bacterium]
SFEIVNSTSPTVNAAGEIAIDTDADGDLIDQGLITYYDGTTQLYAVAVDTLTGLTDNWALTYDATLDKFVFEAQSGGGGSLDAAYNSATATITVDAYDILFDLNDSTNDYGLVIDNNTSGVIDIGLEFTSGGGGVLTTAIEASNPLITNALSLGANTILGTTAVIDFTDFDVSADGLITIANDADGVGLTITPSVSTTTAIDVSDSNITNAINVGANTILGTTAVINFNNFDVSTGGEITVAAGAGIDTNGPGTLDVGATNATVVSICNSAACDTINIGTNADGDTINIGTGAGTADTINIGTAGSDTIVLGESGTTFSVTSSAFVVSTTGAVSGVTTMSSSDDWTWTATTPNITINNGEVFTIVDDATVDTFTVDTSGSLFSFADDGGNSFTFDVDTGPVYAGNARPTRQVTLTPEYAGAVMTGDTSSNTGTMTSDFCEQGVTAAIADINTADCESGEIHNYYQWTTTQGSAQDYDIWIRWRVPDNFAAWPTNPISVEGRRTDVTNNAVTVELFDTASASEISTQVAGAANTWVDTSLEATFTGTYTAGSYMTFQIKMNADTNDDVQAGEITINYLSNN